MGGGFIITSYTRYRETHELSVERTENLKTASTAYNTHTHTHTHKHILAVEMASPGNRHCANYKYRHTCVPCGVARVKMRERREKFIHHKQIIDDNQNKLMWQAAREKIPS